MSKALIVVDVQKDFCEGGSLGVEGGNDVAEAIAEFVRGHEQDYGLIVFSKDDHELNNDNGGHFAVDPDFKDTWPAHCVQGTEGNEFQDAIETLIHQGFETASRIVVKGHGEAAYSVFEGRALPGYRPTVELLDVFGATNIDVVGIATDYCVKATALDAVKAGYSVRVLEGLTAAVAEDTRVEALAEMADAGVVIA